MWSTRELLGEEDVFGLEVPVHNRHLLVGEKHVVHSDKSIYHSDHGSMTKTTRMAVPTLTWDQMIETPLLGGRAEKCAALCGPGHHGMSGKGSPPEANWVLSDYCRTSLQEPTLWSARVLPKCDPTSHSRGKWQEGVLMERHGSTSHDMEETIAVGCVDR